MQIFLLFLTENSSNIIFSQTERSLTVAPYLLRKRPSEILGPILCRPLSYQNINTLQKGRMNTNRHHTPVRPPPPRILSPALPNRKRNARIQSHQINPDLIRNRKSNKRRHTFSPSGIHNRLPHIVEGLFEFEVNNFLSYHCRTETYLRNRRISAGSLKETGCTKQSARRGLHLSGWQTSRLKSEAQTRIESLRPVFSRYKIIGL